MKNIMNAASSIAFVMHILSGVLLVSMMFTIIADVISRAVYRASDGSIDFTFFGGIELVSYGLLYMILFSFPYSVSRSQVIVDFFTENMSEKTKSILAGIYTCGFGLLGLAMTIRFINAVERVALTGETTQDLLIPMTYIYGITAIATSMLAVRGFLVGIEQIIESRKM